MLTLAGLLLAATLVLTTAVPRVLAAAPWPVRSPTLALLLWQAVGLAGGLLALEAGATLALAPFGPTPLAAVRGLTLSRGVPWWSWLAALVTFAVFFRLITALATSTLHTLRLRHRHRVLVDLLAVPSAALRGARVVAHDTPVAYCLPGLRPRVVLSRGALDLLAADELAAVLAHERAHLTQRHDLVVLPFSALGATFRRRAAVRLARRQVTVLVEMLADDRAARRHDRTVLARALYKVGTSAVPAGGLGAGGDVLLRAQRLLAPPSPLRGAAATAIVAAALAIVALPVLGVLAPHLG